MYLKIEKMYEDVIIPSRAKHGDSGLDLRAYIKDKDGNPSYIRLWPQSPVAIPTGIKMEIPYGTEGQVRPRSGNSIKYNISILNTPGTIDSGYRGEVKVILYFTGPNGSFQVDHGMKIAQLVICPVIIVEPVVASSLSDSERKGDGIGSTGI
jgi:dUTP pyrophosphatase